MTSEQIYEAINQVNREISNLRMEINRAQMSNHQEIHNVVVSLIHTEDFIKKVVKEINKYQVKTK